MYLYEDDSAARICYVKTIGSQRIRRIKRCFNSIAHNKRVKKKSDHSK